MPPFKTATPERDLPALRRSDDRDPTLDAMCRTAAALFGVRYAFVSYLDTECQLFLGREGLDVQTTSRSIAFCARTVLGAPHEPLIVLDTHRDPRFAGNPLVTGAPYLRFYVGVPIAHAGGSNTATVCIADDAPRNAFGEVDRHRLLDLAKFIEATLCGRAAQIEAEHAREQAEAAYAALRESEYRYRLLAENANDVIVLGDLDMRRLYISPAVRTVLGYEPEELIDTTPTAFGHPDDAHIFADLHAKVLMESDGRFVVCVRHRHKAGHYVWIEASVRSARDPQTSHPVGYVAALRDVTARRKAEEQVRHMALHDALTGLPNRTLLRDRLDQAIARAACSDNPFAVLVCDLDRFKAVNDLHGHAAGDALLVQAAKRMLTELRPSDTLARVGGDEFVVVLAGARAPQRVAEIAGRLVESLGRPFQINEHRVEIGASAGVALFPEDGSTAEALLRAADTALYRVKDEGRGAVRFFEATMDAQLQGRRRLEHELGGAIDRDELRLFYQPIVNARTGEIETFEALIRWQHPERGFVSPAEFIPVAEHANLIGRIGEWVIDTACAAAAAWPQPWRVSVNVSPTQFRQSDVPAIIAAALVRHGLTPARLVVEITESVFIQDAAKAVQVLTNLRGLGVRLALDDFGTGYSSLSYLQQFRFDKIKVDQSFVRRLGEHADTLAIVRAIVNLGHNLGLQVTVEGVETAEQLAILRELHCEQMQGYLFARPAPTLPASELELARLRALFAE